ncbi:GGDEF domain-containing protein [Pseudomonas oligotrophica]|uniref:GGDEF domain-containing protein n=1 Tax=Pseudomonas oligotrophica TaxID=2912055 RepID=UPI001F334362|nr:GGDEF domain-containing protein [Pseudomonas oligotrophica]MCF7200683.1 GGDEF domain-containing protein [Pseudomonas oligotrophica]
MQISNEELVGEWQRLCAAYPLAAAQALRQLAERQSAELARYFYAQMLADPQSALFLNHEQVKTRLSQSMQRWVCNVFRAPDAAGFVEVVEQQRKVGEIHARIEIPVSLVLRGARALKQRLRELLEEHGLEEPLRRQAARLGADVIDLAIEIMCFAFSQSHDRNSRAEEAYRLFSVSQNVGVEKERQRAALLDWENQLMFDLAVGNTAVGLPQLAGSEFGLWFRHKASHAFQGSPESASILDYIAGIDRALLQLRGGCETSGEGSLDLLHQIREQTRAIRFLLDSLFEQASDLEAGRDVLTRLLNRKFLPVVLGKEVLYSRQSGSCFGVLAIDVDHFKQVNDRHGHDGGDQVLQQIATLLASNSRGGDYAFRLGGEEFLMVLVDIDASKALQIAEKLRKRIASETLRLQKGGELRVTVSIGMAVHDGHPDYERLLKRADQALYQAKREGRNRCVVHGGD